jgi:hypothetical protein
MPVKPETLLFYRLIPDEQFLSPKNEYPIFLLVLKRFNVYGMGSSPKGGYGQLTFKHLELKTPSSTIQQ